MTEQRDLDDIWMMRFWGSVRKAGAVFTFLAVSALLFLVADKVVDARTGPVTAETR